MSRAGGSAISVFIDGAYIRAVPGYQSRHFEIAMGRVASPGRPPANTMSKLGEDVAETLEEFPRRFKVIEALREKFTCRDCGKIT